MIITLLTDFGTRDTYVGAMKGVILGIAPEARVIDLTHEIPPQDIAAGAWALKTAHCFFPPGTIHLVVVDPGVGSARRPVAAHIGDYHYVCPDNGLLSYVLAENTPARAVTLDDTQYHRGPVSRTFHGRDVFAPVAAYLARRVPLGALGTATDTLETFPLSRPDVGADVITCHVIHVDVYGNVFTDLTEDVFNTWADTVIDIQVNGQDIPGPAQSYSDVAVGRPVALFGSSGHLEIAVRNGSARHQLGLERGDTVEVCRRTPE